MSLDDQGRPKMCIKQQYSHVEEDAQSEPSMLVYMNTDTHKANTEQFFCNLCDQLAAAV